MGFSTHKMHSFYEKRTKRDEIYIFFFKFSYGLKKPRWMLGFLFSRAYLTNKKKKRKKTILLCARLVGVPSTNDL